MIVVTGAAGFIGSYMIRKLNDHNFRAIVAVDDFGNKQKNENLAGVEVLLKVHREDFIVWLGDNQKEVEFVFHLGARTDTTEFDRELLWRLNTDYSKRVWECCVRFHIPLIYASSAATYGLGEYGYNDSEDDLHQLVPLNPYGESKHEFDKWAISQDRKPFYWSGLKFFNVYGAGEHHKGRMASVVWHAFHQIQRTGQMKLFRSHNADYKDGEQKRDFVYVDDVADVMYFLMHHRQNSGIYNLGSGQARTFADLTRCVFKAMDVQENIEFIDTPLDIRDKYQYFTEANMSKLREIGYDKPFTSLEDGVATYVNTHLSVRKRD